MSSTLRAVAVASCTALLVTGASMSVGASGAAGAPAFSVRPTFGPTETTVTLTGADFSSDTTVTFNGALSLSVTHVSSHRLTAVVPANATSGRVAVSDGTTTTNGPIFTVQTPTHGTSSLSTHKLTYANRLLVAGVETMAGSGPPVVGQEAVLQHRVPGSKQWHNARGTHVKRTGPHGGVRWKVTPSANGRFRIHFRQTHSFAGTTTRGQSLRVLPRLHLRPVHTVPVFSNSAIRGSIHPRRIGRVYLQEFLAGSWQTVRHTAVEAGHYSFAISPSSLGKLRYRVVSRFDGTHAHSTSHQLRLQVVHRTLRLDNVGPDVKALQRRLRKLHYDVGPVNSDYGWDTLHAVTAFQKVQGISPDGETGPKVWRALNHPKRISLRYPTAGTYEVEVDIGKEVLLLGKNGHVTHILDTSTGGGYLYTNSEGGTSRAITPTGHFSIQSKLTGWHKSKLGELYYPSYFTNSGYAIHGEGNGNDGGEVPSYPASHGCVRITNDAVLRYFSTPWLAIGSSVWVYG